MRTLAPIILLAILAAVSLISEVKAAGLVILAAGIGAVGLVAYFKWRTTLRCRILAEREDHREAA
jgi:hypothetical protein